MLCHGCRNFGRQMQDIRTFATAYRDAPLSALERSIGGTQDNTENQV